VILIDTGPLVALFDPADGSRDRCLNVLKSIEEPIGTTVPVLTEAFHLLMPASVGSQRLMDFIAEGGLTIWFLDDKLITRAFELMIQYADRPMDLADASLVVTAETEQIRKIFTIDRSDFENYRVKRGHRYFHLELIN
jgi:hypothetical protein